MKRFLALLLALLMMVSLVACGDSKDSSKDDKKTETSEKGENKSEKKSEKVTFTETTLVDNDYCAITIKEVDPDDPIGFLMKAKLENKSSDKTYTFSINYASVNGVQVNPFLYADIAPGKTANEDIQILDSFLEENGIDTFTDIALNFSVYNGDDFTEDPVVDEVFHIYPYGEDKAEDFVREPKSTDETLIDNEYCTVILEGYDKDGSLGYAVKLFMLNKTDEKINISSSEESINGVMMDALFSVNLPAGNCSFQNMTWFASELEDNDIKDVTDLEFTLTVNEAETWDSLAEETIKLKP